ncbi:cytochrome P-450 cyp509A1, partial [Lichtheimia hyalospora FSU 10163]
FPKGDGITTRKGTLLGRFAFGPNLVTLEGQKWKQHRMIANPAFHRSMPVGLFGNLCEKLFSVMGDSDTTDFRGLTERFALDAIGCGGFGFDFNAVLDQNSPWVIKYLDIISAGFDPFFLVFSIFDKKLRFLFPSRLRAHQQLSEFLLKMQEIINYKRHTLKTSKDTIKDSEKDLLMLMIEAEKDGEAALTDDELMSNLCVFFIAGHDTTANAMACAAYYLAKNPDIQAKAREEAIRILGDEPRDIFPSIEQTRQMTYITKIMKETLRLNPPLPNASFRVAARDTEIDGVFIPKGTRIQVDIYESQHNPRVWQDPEVFNPERFALDGEADHIEGFGWVPFGNGTRQCIGMNFSLAEQRVFLSMLLRKYELSLPLDTIHTDGIVTHGMPVSAPVNMQITYKNRY